MVGWRPACGVAMPISVPAGARRSLAASRSVAGVTSNMLPSTRSTGHPDIASRNSETGRIARLIFPSIL